MILHGKDLIISANGNVIAGAKSCDVEVECDTIPTSSPTDGQWEHKIVGRKSWKVSFEPREDLCTLVLHHSTVND